MSAGRKFTLSFMALVILVSSLGMNTYPALINDCSKHHTIKKNESLETIGKRYHKSVHSLMSLNNIPDEKFIFVGQKLCVAGSSPKPGEPAIFVKNTKRDTHVTLRITGFPRQNLLEIYMGAQGTQARNGIKVATATVGNSGVVEITVDIPVPLRGQARLALLAQDKKTRLSATRAFNNMTSLPGSYSDMPTAGVTRAPDKKSIIVTLVNAPAGATYKVALASSVRRVLWFLAIPTINTGSGGSISATIKVPGSLKGNKLVYVILQDARTGSFAYASFSNK